MTGATPPPKVAGKGVGLKLLEAVENATQDFKLKKLRLSASLNAVVIYKKHGYVETGKGAISTASRILIPYVLIERWLMPAEAGAASP